MYAFRDLVALKVVKSLIDSGMSLQRVRRAWDFLNKEVGLDSHLAGVKLETDGKSIFRVIRREGEVMDALRKGQMAFFVAIDDCARQVSDEVAEFRRDRDQFLRVLKDGSRGARLGMGSRVRRGGAARPGTSPRPAGRRSPSGGSRERPPARKCRRALRPRGSPLPRRRPPGPRGA